MQWKFWISAVTVLTRIAVCAALPLSAQAAEADLWQRPASVPHPADNAPTAERVALGKQLFFDPRLSGSSFLSCATCHNPSMGWSDGLATGLGHEFKRLGRATPTILNAVYQPLLMWDGRKPNLEEQALGPIESAGEMNMPLDALEKRLQGITGYKPLFESAYPGEGITRVTVGKALASFERTVVSTESPFDRWRQGQSKAISDSAKRGFEVFNGKGNCAKCHQGFNFSDNGFHNIGVKSLTDVEDEGRFAHRKIKILKGAFKTPTLRDVALTGPYMHNGVYQTLEEVVEHYDRGGDVKTNLSPNMQPLGLTAEEKRDLVAFMLSLTGAPMVVTLPQLPPN
jgi:cytochrome c peroxidase